MKWSEDAEKAIKKVPFFVRKKISGEIKPSNIVSHHITAAELMSLISFSGDVIREYCFRNESYPITAIN